MKTNRRDLKKQLGSLVRKLRDGYNPDKIILFGSMAGGNIKGGSDIDLLVIKNTKQNPWERLRRADRFIDHKVPVDLLVYTPQEVRRRIEMGDAFIEEIMESGEVVYEK